MTYMNKKLYEALPKAYVVLGTASLLLLDNIFGLVAGVNLITAGLLVFHLRLENRG